MGDLHLSSSPHFSLKLNTKTINDGPKLLWFKAVDKHGSTGI